MRIKVVQRVSDRTPRAGQRVRFFGTAAPQHDGRNVTIQRQTPTGTWKTVARTRLQDAGDERSKFGHRLRVRRDAIYPGHVSRATPITRPARALGSQSTCARQVLSEIIRGR